MAKTIYQRIALEGGEAISRQLRALGKEGEAAFVDIATAAKKLQSDLGKLKGAFGDFGASLTTVGKRLGIVSAAAGAAAGGAVALVKGAGDAAREIDRLSQVSNTTPRTFQQWAFAAQKVGIEQEKLADILKDTNDRVGDFVTTGGGPMADFFEKVAPLVGVTADQFARLSGPEALQLYVSSLERAGLSQQELTFYMEALASDATLLLPLLRDNGKAMASLSNQADLLGAVLDSSALGALRNADEALGRTGAAVLGLKLQIAALLAPSVSAGADELTIWLARNNRAIRDFLASALTRVRPAMADIMNALAGNDAAVQSQWILDARDATIAFADAVYNAITGIIIPAYQALVAVAETVAGAINGIFGTEFTGQQVLIAGVIAKFLGLFSLLGAAVGVVTATFTALGSAWTLLVASGAFIGPLFAGIAAAAKVAGVALVGLVSIPALIIAGIVAAGVAIYVFWDEIKAGFSALGEFLSEGAIALGELIGAGFSAAADMAAVAWTSITDAAWRAWDGIVSVFGGVGDWLADRFNAGIDLIGAGWSRLVAGASSAWQWMSDGFNALWQSIIDGFDWVGNAADRLWGRIKSIAASIRSALRSAVSSASDSAPGYATGGHVRGPGSGTSDSILARLSNGEYVIRAAAVKYYGPQLLDALNRMRIPRMPGFAVGGLVDGLSAALSPRSAFPAIPAFASGGPVMRPVNFTIGGEAYEGLTAPVDVVERLTRHATRRHLASAGRKPGWVK